MQFDRGGEHPIKVEQVGVEVGDTRAGVAEAGNAGVGETWAGRVRSHVTRVAAPCFVQATNLP